LLNLPVTLCRRPLALPSLAGFPWRCSS